MKFYGTHLVLSRKEFLYSFLHHSFFKMGGTVVIFFTKYLHYYQFAFSLLRQVCFNGKYLPLPIQYFIIGLEDHTFISTVLLKIEWK
jgi:hypothetical protein